jgi:hypothetical protein
MKVYRFDISTYEILSADTQKNSDSLPASITMNWALIQQCSGELVGYFKEAFKSLSISPLAINLLCLCATYLTVFMRHTVPHIWLCLCATQCHIFDCVYVPHSATYLTVLMFCKLVTIIYISKVRFACR